MPSSTALFTDLNHRHVASSPSTNSELIEHIKTGTLASNEVHLLTAETQTAGRGQHQRSWQSPLGNVYLSLYCPVQIPVSGLLSLIIGVELAKMPIIQMLNKQLQSQNMPFIGVKWANDLGFYRSTHLDDASQNSDIILFNKLAGILIEPVWQAGKLIGVVIGVGLNVRTTPKLTAQTLEGMSYQAVSLQDMYELLKLPQQEADLPSLTILYQQVSKALLAAIACFEQITLEKSALQHNYADEFLRQFDALDALVGLQLRITQHHNDNDHIIEGEAQGIDTNGCLQLRLDNGKISTLFTGRIDVINQA